MVFQWVAALIFTFSVTPRTWVGESSVLHPHVWLALCFGGAITSLPVGLAILRPGRAFTRQTIAVCQMLTSSMLIHISGGRIETHFHIFGSLAFLAFYCDWGVLVTASVVVAGDHLLQGLYWPQSIYGVTTVNLWRTFEHAGWVIFEDIFLMISIRQKTEEMLGLAERQARLEAVNEEIEQVVAARTAELECEIAERRNSELALRESDLRFRQIAENIHEIFWMAEPDGSRMLYVSPAYEQICGRSCASLYAKPAHWIEPIVEEDRSRVIRGLGEVGNGVCFELDFRLSRPDASIRWLRVRGFPVRDAAGIVVRACGICEDITERRSAEVELRKLSRAVEQSPVSIIITDNAGAIEYVNGKFVEVTGYSAAEVLGKNPRLLNSGRTPRKVFTELWAAITAGEEWQGEFLNRRKDGELFWEFATISPIRNTEGQTTNFVAVKEDITARKHAEAALDKVEKELRDASRVPAWRKSPQACCTMSAMCSIA